jgi:hypothetical protein
LLQVAESLAVRLPERTDWEMNEEVRRSLDLVGVVVAHEV